ncbi:MAG: PEP/pyruvate-binding domain-containing protein [Thermodesulfobacteriota bacterium]
MDALVIGLDEVGRGDVAVAGGKGANLGDLLRRGFPVPPGFVVTAQSCRRFFERLNLDPDLKKIGAAPEEKDFCAGVRTRIDGADFPPELAADLMKYWDLLLDRRGREVLVAVRSSATAEDLGDASFAGQHETYYYVTRDNLTVMVKRCWSSLFSPEAVSYRTTQGLGHEAVFMAVVVQEMIPAEVSGVTFTANPVTGDGGEIVTEASWGLGAAIVDGRVTPDHYVLKRLGFTLKEKRISEKRFMVPPHPAPGTTRRLDPVPHWKRHRPTLTIEQVRQVAEWSVKAEEHFGGPQDVEWAMAEDRFYMLQSRPITVLGREEIGKGLQGRWVIFKPIVENFTDPLTPLTQDILLLEAPLGFKVIRGWVYTNFNLIKALLPFRAKDENLARMLTEMGDKAPDLPLHPLKLPGFLILLLGFWLMTAVFLARTRRLPDDFMDGYRDLCRQVTEDPAYGPAAAMRRLWSSTWKRFLDPAGYMVVLINLSSARYMIGREILRKLLKLWAPDLGDEAVALLCAGSSGVLSAEMGRGICRLAQAARNNPAVRAVLEKYKPDHLLAALNNEPEAQEFLAQLAGFLAVNGHRALKELELKSVRWEEDPTPVLGMIRNYLLAEVDPEDHEREIARTRARLEESLRERLRKRPLEKALGLRWRVLKYVADRTKYFTKMRENSRFYHIMGYGVVRRKILKVEADLLQRGKLKCKDDIFFLRLDEIAQLKADELGWLDVEDRIRERRLEHIRLSKITPPRAIGLKIGPQAEASPAQPDDPRVLRGQAASPGRYEGTAHVILDPSLDLELKPGEILVAPYTDPAWTPLFLTAGAAVVEVGSYLSHAGTVAREFGMPCVVDVADCTKRLHTGHHLIVNGDEGWVRIAGEDQAR